MEFVQTDKAPKPIGPYSQAVRAGSMLFVSGQIPIDPETGKLVQGSFKDKARRALMNLVSIVEASGGSIENIVKVTVYLTDISRFPEFNQVYEDIMKGHKPARAVIGVASLPAGAEIEVEAIAILNE